MFTRKQLLCRSEQELRRLCRRSGIKIDGSGPLNKRDLVDFILLHGGISNSSSNNLKKKNKPRSTHKRLHSVDIAATVTDDVAAPSHTTKNYKSRPDTLYALHDDHETSSGYGLRTRSPKWQSSSPSLISLSQSRSKPHSHVQHHAKQQQKQRQKQKENSSKPRHFRRTQSATLPSSILSSINEKLSKKSKHKSKSNRRSNPSTHAEFESQTAFSNNPPTLKMESLLQFHSAGLHESVEYESDDDLADVFIEHMSLSEIRAFRVDDCLDFRADSGVVFGATIMNKTAHVLTISFKERSGKLRTVDCDYHKALHRFARYQSISQRSAHRMTDVQIGSMVDVRPTRHVGSKLSSEWMVGEVVMKDSSSGQCQIEYSHRSQKRCYWVHVDNSAEVAPYLSHYDFRQFALNMDRYLDVDAAADGGDVDGDNDNGGDKTTATTAAAVRGHKHVPKFTKAATVDISHMTQATTTTTTEIEDGHKYNDDLDDFFYDDEEDEKSDEQTSRLLSSSLRPSTYHLWNYNDVINWLNSIEHNRFNDKYDRLKRAIIAYDINHSRLSQLNELTLKVLGVTDESDRQLMLSFIAEITHSSASSETAIASHENVHAILQSKEQEIAHLKQQIAQLHNVGPMVQIKPKRIKKHASSLSFDATSSMSLPPLKASNRRGSRHRRRKSTSKYMSELRRLSSFERIVANENAMITSDTEWPYDS